MKAIAYEQIENDIKEILHRLRPELHGEIKATDRLRDDLGLDSLYSMELLSELTEKYEIDLDPEQLQDVHTVGEVTQFLTTFIQEQA